MVTYPVYLKNGFFYHRDTNRALPVRCSLWTIHKTDNPSWILVYDGVVVDMM